jgi:hypothetical protein
VTAVLGAVVLILTLAVIILALVALFGPSTPE